MKPGSVFTRLAASFVLMAAFSTSLHAQAPGVAIMGARGDQLEASVKKVNELATDGKLLSIDQVKAQLSRKSCVLELPGPATRKLTDREVWKQARAAYIRIGWHYRCKDCHEWHQDLAGGYFISEDGVIATCEHVVAPADDMREGFLVAATEDGRFHPVSEVLASDSKTDTAIVRVRIEGRTQPLPLNVNVYPGDPAWCYSDPLDRSGYFSKGMVNGFYMYRGVGGESPRMEVSTDWAPGSSGSAVLDECGNAIGHVSEISSEGLPSSGSKRKSRDSGTVIVFHCAARAADVVALVKSSANAKAEVPKSRQATN